MHGGRKYQKRWSEERVGSKKARSDDGNEGKLKVKKKEN